MLESDLPLVGLRKIAVQGPIERSCLRCNVDERELTIAWRNLFSGKEIDQEQLAKAQAILDELSGESPLHHRLAKELDELKKLQKPRVKTRKESG
jgi:hypothetical protein